MVMVARGQWHRQFLVILVRRERRSGARLGVVLAVLLGFGACLLLSACAGPDGPKSGEGPEYVLIPPPPQQPRIQFLTSYSKDVDVLPPLSGFRRFIVGEREGRELAKPYGVAIHEGQLLVCDTKLGVVAIFDLAAQTLEVLGEGPNGQLSKPVNITVDEDGTRYVTDSELNRVMVYDANNRYVRAIGDPEAWSPTDVAIVGKRLYVTDKKNRQVVLIEKATGEELRRFDQPGEGDGNLALPTNLALGADGSVYVTDTGGFRVLKFDDRGELIQTFGSLGKMVGEFVRPKGVAVDREDRVYVVDASTEVVQIFNSDGKLMLFFGGAGNHPGGLNIPAQVVIDYDNVDFFADRVAPGYRVEYLIIVTSQFGANKVNVFGFLEPDERSND
jgi:DNA-binding beta-propeller fold protein YncE